MAIEHAVVPLRFLGWDQIARRIALRRPGAHGLPSGARRFSGCARRLLRADDDAALLGVRPKSSAALYIQRIAYLADGRCVEFTRSCYRSDTFDFVVRIDAVFRSPASDGGSDVMSQTFMAAEIAEAGAVVASPIGRQRRIDRASSGGFAGRASHVRRTVARGSSDHAALYLKHLIELKLGLACASLGPSIASLYHAPLKLEGAVAIAISQSGQSPDIVAMQRAAKAQRAMTIAFVNDEESPLAQEADALLPLCAGAERSVAATKSMIASLVAGASLVADWSDDPQLRAALTKLPSVLDASSAAARLRRKRSRRWPKLRPCSSSAAAPRTPSPPRRRSSSRKRRAIHAEAFSSAEVLHGPAGIIGPGFPVLAFAPADAARPGFFDTLDRLAAFGATPLLVDIEPHKRWPTMVALDGGHPLLDPDRGASRFLPRRRIDRAPARARPRPAAPSQEGHRDFVSGGN